MLNIKNTLFTLASVVALSQPALANESAQLSKQASVALNSILADNIADIQSSKPAESANQTIAKLETQLRNNLLAQQALNLLPQTPQYKVVFAD